MAIIVERMLSNYQADPNSGCWLWEGSTNPSGYGKLHDREARKGYSAHRFFYEHHIGKIEHGLVLMHKCDTRLCVNPDHLQPGTVSDNARDAAQKGRCRSGYGYARPSQESKAKMAQAVQNGEAIRSVAKRFAVDPKTVRNARVELKA